MSVPSVRIEKMSDDPSAARTPNAMRSPGSRTMAGATLASGEAADVATAVAAGVETAATGVAIGVDVPGVPALVPLPHAARATAAAAIMGPTGIKLGRCIGSASFRGGPTDRSCLRAAHHHDVHRRPIRSNWPARAMSSLLELVW